MKHLTITTALALTASGLVAAEAGEIKTFAVDGIHGHFFAMLPGIDGKLALTALTVSFEGGYKVKGIAGAFGPSIMFVDATLSDGTVAEIKKGDFVLNDKTDLVLPLAETLAMAATAGLGHHMAVHLNLGKETTFTPAKSAKGATMLWTFNFGKSTYGVYANPDQTHVVKLEQIADGTFRATGLIDTFRTAVLRGAIVDKQLVAAA